MDTPTRGDKVETVAITFDVSVDPEGRIRINLTVDEMLGRDGAYAMATIVAINFAKARLGRFARPLEVLPVLSLGGGKSEHYFAEMEE